MTLWSAPGLGASRQDRRLVVLMLVRVALSMAALFAAYFLIPTRGAGHGSDVPMLLAELCVFAVIVAAQIPAIVKATHPVLRAIEALAIVVPVYLLMFARIYLSTSLDNPSAFNHQLDNVMALYFTVTTFATVGYGDIVATTDGMRLLVTLQMILNLVILGAVIRLLAMAARRGVQRRGGPDLGGGPLADPLEPGQLDPGSMPTAPSPAEPGLHGHEGP